MNAPVFFAIFGTAVGATLAAQSWPLSRAPGWNDLRWFSLAAFTAALATACTLGTTLPVPPEVVPWTGRLQLFFLALHVAAWWEYGAVFVGRPLGARGRILSWAYVGLGIASLVPGLAYGTRTWIHDVPALGASYNSVEPTPVGVLVFAAVAAVPVALAFRMLRARSRGVERAGMLALAFFAGTSLGLHDAAVVTFELPLPYLLEFGHILPILVAAWVNVARHTGEARALDRHRQGLADAVRERTHALEAVKAALIEAEKAAAVGRFSARLAHEMSGPVAAVAANLRYLVEEVDGQDRLPPDGRECLRESREAIERVGRISRELVDAARLGVSRPEVDGEPEPPVRPT
ncbi:MAG TPA: hypothetical protein VLS93_08995 [Anaeromyxobacteraceae bacterium]|nr:hypothetical protein [Anaeromyxobacteraceae bacterium]